MASETNLSNGSNTTDTQHDSNGRGLQEEEEKSEEFTKFQLFTLFAIGFANLCSCAFYSLLAPFFPTEAQKKGASETEIGIILGVFQAVILFSSPFFGNYITTIGSRFMFNTGIFVSSTCVILFGVLEWCPGGAIYVVMCLCVRTVEGLACAAITTSSQAIAAHSFSNRLSLVMGILQACNCVGHMMGPPIGGALYSVDGFYLPFVVSGGLFMFGGVVSVILLPAQKDEQKVELSGSKLEVMRIPVILLVGYGTAAGQFAMGFSDVALAIHLEPFNLHPAVVGLLFLIPPIMVVLLGPLVGWLNDKCPALAWPLMIVGSIMGAAGFLLMGRSPLLPFLPSGKYWELWLVIIGSVLAGIGWAGTIVMFPIFVKAAHDKGFPDTMETQGLVSGVFNVFVSVGALIGPTVGGIMTEKLDFPWAATITAGIIAVFLLLLAVHTVCEYRSSCREKPKEKLELIY